MDVLSFWVCGPSHLEAWAAKGTGQGMRRPGCRRGDQDKVREIKSLLLAENCPAAPALRLALPLPSRQLLVRHEFGPVYAMVLNLVFVMAGA
jgi:hypothetical protein